jgi:hypothetical protein
MAFLNIWPLVFSASPCPVGKAPGGPRSFSIQAALMLSQTPASNDEKPNAQAATPNEVRQMTKNMRPVHSTAMQKTVPSPAFCLDLTLIRESDRYADVVLFSQELTDRANSLPPEVLPILAQTIVSLLGAGFTSRPDLEVMQFPWPPIAGEPLASHLEALRFEDGGKRLIVLRPAIEPEASSYAGLNLSKAARARGMTEAVIVSHELFQGIRRCAGGNLIETFTRLTDELAELRRMVGTAGPLSLRFRMTDYANGKPHVVACVFQRLTDPKGRCTLLGFLAA